MVASLLGQNERKIDLRIKFVMKRKVELSILKDLEKKKKEKTCKSVAKQALLEMARTPAMARRQAGANVFIETRGNA